MRSGTQATKYHVEMFVQNNWSRTKHSFDNRQEARDFFSMYLDEHPTWWVRLVSETVLETVTP